MKKFTLIFIIFAHGPCLSSQDQSSDLSKVYSEPKKKQESRTELQSETNQTVTDSKAAESKKIFDTKTYALPHKTKEKIVIQEPRSYANAYNALPPKTKGKPTFLESEAYNALEPMTRKRIEEKDHE